jgi:hypothetical protein
MQKIIPRIFNNEVYLFDASSLDGKTFRTVYTKSVLCNGKYFDKLKISYSQYRHSKRPRGFIDKIRVSLVVDRYEKQHGKIQLLHRLPNRKGTANNVKPHSKD